MDIINRESLAAFVDARVEAKLTETLGEREERPLSTQEAAEFLGVSTQRIHDLTSAGKLARLGPRGTKAYYRRADVLDYMERRGTRSRDAR